MSLKLSNVVTELPGRETPLRAGDAVRILPVKARRLIAVCGKCSRKLDGGFGDDGDRPLAKVLRRAMAGGGGKKAVIRIVETKCLDICPKRAAALIDSSRPGEVVIVPARTPTETLIARLDVASGG